MGENTNIDLINIDNAYKSNSYTFGFTITFCIIFAVMTLFIIFRMYLQFQRLVLGTDALKKAEEENSGYSDDEYSVTDSNEDMDANAMENTSSESEDTLDEYGFANSSSRKEKFLFEEEYEHSNENPNQTQNHKVHMSMNSHTDSELEDIDISNSELRSRSDFEDSDGNKKQKKK